MLRCSALFNKLEPMKKVINVIIVLALLGAAGGGYVYYNWMLKSITQFDQDEVVVYVKTGTSYESFKDQLEALDFKFPTGFDWLAQKKNLKSPIKGGKYRLKKGLSAADLINKMRIGDAESVSVTFNNIRLKTELAGKIGAQIEADSMSIIQLLNDGEFLSKYGMKKSNAMVLFIPNTYQFKWNTSAEELFDRMAQEFKTFWNEERLSKAKKIGLSQTEVATLASLVEAEQSKIKEEWPVIAGLYINRIHKGMKLQSDPTVVYAMQDFTINRVLTEYTKIDSPYNTYRYKGLPPGPIRLADPRVMDAVLNYQRHNYYYMCAKGDGSFQHRFANSYNEHLRNARIYQQELNKAGIYR